VAAVEKTTLTAAVPFVFESADRSAAIEDGTLHRQIVQAIQLQSRSGIGEARLTLQPEYLGDVTIVLRVEDGGVTAHVSAAAADVRAWLGTNEAILRQGLAEHGLTLNRLVVSDQPADTSRDTKDGTTPRQQQPEQHETPQQRPRPRPDNSTFEITV
jgi:flagellar hook-length control protein FliK